MRAGFVCGKSAYVFCGRLAAMAVLFLPYSLQKMDFRATFTRGLSLSTHKASPAYAAFEDLRANYSVPAVRKPAQVEILAAGEALDPRWIQKTIQQRQIVMKGMTFKMPAQYQPVIPALPAVSGPSEEMIAANAVEDGDPSLDFRDNAGRLLPISTRRRMLANKLKENDWSQPSVGAVAMGLVEAEVQAQIAANENSGSAVGGGVIANNDDDGAILDNNKTRNFRGRTIARNDRDHDRDLLADLVQPPPNVLSDGDVPNFSAFTTITPNPAFMRPLWLSGFIEMTGGLAFTGADTQIMVKRVLDGQVLEKGRIWISEGKFEIHVKKPVGQLVAEIYTRDGRVLGRGQMELLDLTTVNVKNDRVDDLRIALFPTSDGVALRPVSGYSHGTQKIAVREPRVEIQQHSNPIAPNDDGVVTDPSLGSESSYVARAQAKDHWPSLVVGQAHQPQDIELLSKSLVQAVVNLGLRASDRKEAMYMSMVWGHVRNEGKAVAGATVEMAGDYQPIYFNDLYLPDKNLKATSGNGLFAFLHVKSGVQAIRLRVGGRLYPAHVFPTEEQHVSFTELSIQNKIVTQFRVLDASDFSKGLPAQIKLVGTEQPVSVQPGEAMRYAIASGAYMVEADAGADYEISRATVTGAPGSVIIPAVKREWLFGLAEARSITPVQDRGSIVGFVDGQDFEVEMTGYPGSESMQIVYFDAAGAPVEGRTGVAGGGFAIFNAPPGLQTVYIHPTQSRETFAQVLVAEPEYVHVLTWSPR